MPEPKNAAFAAYVPALHRGYMELFARYPYVQTFYIFGQSILDQEDYLRKDLRALDPTQQRTVIGGLKRFKHIEIIEKKDLATIAKKHELLILPDEDISHRIADLAPGGQYEFSPIFLRWDRRSSAERQPIRADRTISATNFDHDVIKRAQKASRKSTNIWRRVGAVIVQDDKLLAEGSNRQQPTDHSLWIDGDPRALHKQGEDIDKTTDMHAEARLIARAARQGTSLKGASIYVSTFPCPNCAKLIAEAGFSKCYYSGGYAVLDGELVLKANKVELIHVDEPEDGGHPAEWVSYKSKK